jgi:uncharacterized membrane protein YfcA
VKTPGPEEIKACPNCGREFPVSLLDKRLWCPDCRQAVIRRATIVGRLAGIVIAAALGIWIFSMVGIRPRFMMFYLLLVAAVYFFVYKVTQRVAFEFIRERGVPPPIAKSDEPKPR